MPPIDRSKEQMVSCCWNWAVVVIGFSPVLIPMAIISTPYFAYKGVKALSKKCRKVSDYSSTQAV
jgi:hypothetical protein